MNIVSLSLCYPSPPHPAAGTFVKRRLQALATHHHVRVICPLLAPFGITPTGRIGQPDHDPAPPPVWYVPMPYIPALSQPLNPLLYARAVEPLLADWVALGSVDLLDAHFAWPDAVAAARLARRLKVPYTVTLRGVIGRYASSPLKRSSILRALRNAAAVIAVSQSLKRIAVELGLPGDRVTVIPNGVDPRTFRLDGPRRARRELKRPDREILLITVGHLCRRKGVHRVLRMLPRLRKRYPTLHYAVVGADAAEGRFEAHLKKRVAALDLRSAVTFTGRLPPEGVARWLNAADLFVLHTANEGCCNAVREARATGLPVVTTDVGGNREWVPPDAGVVVPFGDDDAFVQAITRILAAPPDRDAVARSRPAPTWDHVARRTAGALQNALDRAAHHPRQPSATPCV